ncbi:MAG TPA: hypothetical protein VMG10_15385 [Gemmataceae bacterium]|nr:hypothetical protein [Gemmataceae bacterium]
MKPTTSFPWFTQLLALFVALSSCHLVTLASSAAEKPPDVRTITIPQAQVWCGPNTSNGLYPTNVLRQGDRVQVEGELSSGWLVIRPPAGSFSWINNRFVQYISSRYANYVVTYDGHDVPVLIGSSLKTDRPSKIGAKLPRGAQVRVVGRGMTDEEGTWLPIEPPEGEVRYLRKEAVANPAPNTTSSAKTAVPPPDADALWRDAQKADQAGRLADAVRLYRLAGDANLSANPSRADEAYRRAHWIEQANSSTNSAGGSAYYPEGATPSASANASPYSLPVHQGGTNVIRPIGGAAPGMTNGQLVATPAVAVATASPQVYYEKGQLQRAFKNEVNRRYHLLNEKGSPFRSVIAGPGVDLSSYEGRNVELWGHLDWDYNRRNWLLTATQVRAMP